MSALTFGSTGASNSVAALGGLGGVLGDRPRLWYDVLYQEFGSPIIL